jgi:hypothetical protein
MTVFKSRVADIAWMHAGMFRQLLGHPGGVRTRLFNPQPIVFTITAKVDVQLLGDDKIIRR